MTDLHWLDHALFVLFVVLAPLEGIRWTRRPRERAATFRATIGQEWAMTLLLVGVWVGLGRSLGDLGRLPSTTVWIAFGWILAAVFCAMQITQVKLIASSAERRAAARKSIGSVDFLFARTATERKLYDVLSGTAGICEELIYRGFVIAYLGALTGLPLWGTIPLSAVIFGFAHSYQGVSGTLRTFAVGLFLAVLYRLTGSLIAPIIVHIVIDLTSGRIGTIVANEEPLADAT